MKYLYLLFLMSSLVTPLAADAASYADDFNRANSTNLGASWVDVNGSGLQIGANRAIVAAVNSYNGSGHTAQLGTADHYAQATIIGIGGGNYFEVKVRHNGLSGASEDGWQCVLGGSNEYYITRVDNGTSSDVETGTVTFAEGDVLRCEASGSSIKLFVDGVLVDSATSSTYSTQRYTGLGIYSSSAASGFDDFSAEDVGAPDTTPNSFSFTDQSGVSLSSAIISAPITVAGINAAAVISVSGGTYDVNGSGSFTSSSGTVNNGDTVRARHTSSASNSTATNTVVTIGGVSDTFTSTTMSSGSGLTHGAQFTVTGSGFGTRGDYGGTEDRLNWKWLNFEAALADDGFNFNSGETTHWVWMNSGNRNAHSARWAKRWNTGNIQYLRTSSSFSTGKFFFSSWQKWSSANGKTWRIWFNNGVDDLWANYGTGAVASDSPNQYVDYGLSVPEDTWVRVDVYMRDGGSNGLLVDIWLNGQNGNSAVYTKDYAATLGTFINPALGAGEDNSSTSMFWGFDDAYMDFSPARVEIADTNTWSARTKSEIQIPLSWADGSITVQANAGSFTSGQTVYVYVIKENLSVVGPVESRVVE
jgi:hypothetical protein